MNDTPEVRNILHMDETQAPYPVSLLETSVLYENREQVAVAVDIISFLNNISRRTQDRVEDIDAMRGALSAATKFAVQTYYENNQRQFLPEHKKEIVSYVEKILNSQLDQMVYAQVLAH